MFPAHLNGESIQSCKDHSIHIANIAMNDIKDVDFGYTAYLAGLLHDSGKFTEEFKKYILEASAGLGVKKGSVIHSFCGVRYLLSKYHNPKDAYSYTAIAAEIISYAIGAHHGLFDCFDCNKSNGFVHRIEKQPEYDQKAIRNFFNECVDEAAVEEYIKRASEEVERFFLKVAGFCSSNRETFIYIGLLARLVCSAVIDGDRRDTAEFMMGVDFSRFIHADPDLWKDCLEQLQCEIKKFPLDTDIQIARMEISDLCAAFSDKPVGIYRLNVPTGGGKTLSSLRYALMHANVMKKKRIVYVAPFISIIDQNADVIRNAVGNDKIVLEHHSNIVPDSEDSDYELLSETWDSPIIVTTMVQLLNTIFSGKTSSVRRFQSLCNSVIVIDEVQSVPKKMLSLFNLAMNFLNRVCDATIILCSATQPCLEDLDYKLLVSKDTMITDEKYKEFCSVFRRTDLVYAGSKTLDSIPGFVAEISAKSESTLVVCNTKKQARELYRQISLSSNNCYHLSANMCMAHRRNVLDAIYESIRSKKRVICVATQVIEAGVDISFETVIRLNAGMDHIVQSSGRCNRNGEYNGLCHVYIVRCSDENLGQMIEMNYERCATDNLLAMYDKDPKMFDFNLSSDKSVQFYYNNLFNILKSAGNDYFDFYSKEAGTTLLTLLAENSSYADYHDGNHIEEYLMRQAFKTAGMHFEVIDQDSETIIVPYGMGSELIEKVEMEQDFRNIKNLLNQSKEYTVSVNRNLIKKLVDIGAVRSVCHGNVLVLCDSYYDSNTGLQVESSK